MNGFSLLLTIASLGAGASYNWRAGVDQQQEFVLQIETDVVQALLAPPRPGEPPPEIGSELPLEAGAVQRLVIAIVPKDGTPVKHTAAGEQQFRQLLINAGRYASRERTPQAADALPTVFWPARAAANPEQTTGVKTGWEPDNVGNQQYIVQIDPTLLRTMAVGDELYVPIDPAAGRVVRFIVKAGREELPRVGGPQSLAGAGGRSRYPGVTDSTGSLWSNNSITDQSRQTPRASGGFSDSPAVDPRASQYGPPTSYGSNAAAVPPTSSYGAYGSPPQATASNYDLYRGSLTTGGEAASPPNYLPQPAASQQPILSGGQRNFDPRYGEQRYGEPRVAALPPSSAPVAATAPLSPSAFTPSTTQPQNPQDKPWGPLLFVTFALFFSIGGNLYLAYTALEFHSRYRSAIERLRSAARSA